MMVNLEDARRAFNAFPDKTLREWGEEWNMSHENVRLMKIKLGIPRKVNYDPLIAGEIVEYIRSGKGTLNTSRTFKKYRFGKVTFMKWMESNVFLKEAVKQAENEALENKLYPKFKKCATTGELLPISAFYKDKNTLDGYSVRSKKVVKERARKYYYDRNVTEPTVDKKTCSGVPELGPIPSKYFHRNRRMVSGLQQYSIAFQTPYSKFLNSDSEYERQNAFKLANKEALIYFKSLGFKEIDSLKK